MNNGTITLTSELIHSAGSYGGHGFNRAQLSLLGVKWPPVQGWLKALAGKTIPAQVWSKVEALKGKTKANIRRLENQKRFGQNGAHANSNSATPANSPCMDGEGFVSHDVSLIETKRGQRWKCKKCGRVLE